MFTKFTPPFPKPNKNKLDHFKRFFAGLGSWIHTLYEKSYTMKLGEVSLPKLKMFLANEKELTHQILLDREKKFPKHYVQHEMLCPLLGESVFSTNGEKWRRQRTMLNPAFAHTNLKHVFDMMKQASSELIDNLSNMVSKKDYIHIDPIMTHVTADIIFRTILSQKLSAEDAHKIHKAFNDYQNYAQKITTLKLYGLPVWFLEKRLDKYAKHIHKVFELITQERYKKFHEMREKEEALPNNDILDALMQARCPDSGEYFTFKDIIDQLSIIFLAGHETSASSLTWALYLLSHCPHLQKAAYEEITSIEELSFENLKQLRITESIFQESLRLYPPVSFFPREAAEDMKIRNKEIHKGDMISVSPWLLQRNSNYWQNPHEFDVERFIDKNSPDKEAIRDCYIPFGKGPRICIGAGFARQEASLILADIIKNFTITCHPTHKVEAVSRMTTRPKNGVYLKLTPRI